MTVFVKGRDPLEDAAFAFLSSRFPNICYEPNGDTTFPDFLADDRVLFEVTRLEKSVTQGGGEIHHSRVFIPLMQTVERTIENFSMAVEGGRDIFVSLDVRFPSDNADLRGNLRNFLTSVAEDPESCRGKELKLTDGVSASVILGSPAASPEIHLGGFVPQDLSGFVVPDTIAQINDALKRKGEKLARYDGRYDEAWLVVGRGSAWGFRNEDIPFFQAGINSDFGWNGVLIIDAKNPSRITEIRFDRE